MNTINNIYVVCQNKKINEIIEGYKIFIYNYLRGGVS